MNKLGLVVAILFSLGVSAQNTNKDADKDRKAIKAEKKAERREMLAKNLDSITALMKEKTYALEATMLRDRYNTYNVLQDNNFIKVDGNEIIIQTANINRMGTNGLGGITVRGQLISYDVKELDNNVSANMTVSTFALGTININISVNSAGNATADLRGNFGLQATFIGDFAPINDLRQYEGIPQF